jgi:hypothetical protein
MDDDTFASFGDISSIFALNQKLVSWSAGADKFQRLGDQLLSLADARGVTGAVRKAFAKVRTEGNDAAHPDLSLYDQAALLERVAREYVLLHPMNWRSEASAKQAAALAVQKYFEVVK